jgi:hypothetical protein
MPAKLTCYIPSRLTTSLPITAQYWVNLINGQDDGLKCHKNQHDAVRELLDDPDVMTTGNYIGTMFWARPENGEPVSGMMDLTNCVRELAEEDTEERRAHM